MDDQTLRDELLAQDQIDPELQAELSRRINNMLEEQLRPVQRIMWIASGIAGMAGFVLLVFLAVKYRSSVPWQATAGIAVTSLFGIAWAAIAYSILKRGKIIRNRHPIQIAGWIWVITLLQFMMLSAVAPQARHHYVATLGMIDSLGFLLIGATWLVTNLISQASIKGEEQFLKLQLQLADMNAKLQRLEQDNGGE